MTPPTFAELQATALNARKRAKAVRKEWKDREPGENRDDAFRAAVKELDDVVLVLKGWRGEDSPYRRDAERDIGDCLGVKGGTYRDWGKYRDAAFSYDEGLPYEREAQQLGGQPNSYCLVQRLVCRVLEEPGEFQRVGSVLGVDLDLELDRSAQVVRDQVKIRTDSRWAQADLALLLQLLGGKSDRGFDRATAAWDELDDMGPDRFVYDSTLETVKALQSRLDQFLDPAARSSWADLVGRLTPA